MGIELLTQIREISPDFAKCHGVECPVIDRCKARIFANEEVSCLFGDPLVRVNRSNFGNATGLEYLERIVQHMVGNSGNTLGFTYVVLDTGFDPPNQNSLLNLELSRVSVAGNISQVSTKAVTEVIFTDNGDSTTSYGDITSVGGTLNSFTYNPIVSNRIIKEGDRCEIKNPAGGLPIDEQPTTVARVMGVSGNNITINKILSADQLQIGFNFHQTVGRLFLVAGGTDQAGQGTVVSAAPFTRIITTAQQVAIQHTVELLGT